ncbi:hypothetical protein [Paracoccus yeei]|uniref:hypothetical protein n=1 Tax=Paracoccus yeei TaxID=147645 RepID=UPI0020C460FE|nr:hypothetical protein [Paracoccus yeei]
MTEIAPHPRIKLSKLRDIGWSLWDPIGLLDPESRPGRWYDEADLSFADEYDSYLIAAASQLRRGTPRDEVVAFLVEIETEHMGRTIAQPPGQGRKRSWRRSSATRPFGHGPTRRGGSGYDTPEA